MGNKYGKPVNKGDEEIVERLQKFQFAQNFWPEPIRKEGTTHDTAEHSSDLFAPGAFTECIGSSVRKGHTFDTRVAAISPNSGHLFLYGDAGTAGSTEKRVEVSVMKVNSDMLTTSCLRYTDYFAADADLLANPGTIDNPELVAAITMNAALTSAPTDPNDDDRKERMKKSLHKIIDAWRDSETSALDTALKKLPWIRKCAGDALEAAVKATCSPDCTIAFPLQQAVVKAASLPAQWRARLDGKQGPFAHWGQTEINVVLEAYAGHHPTAFAQLAMYMFNEASDQHQVSNGVLVAEFDKEGKRIDKLVIFRDFFSETERDSVFIPLSKVIKAEE